MDSREEDRLLERKKPQAPKRTLAIFARQNAGIRSGRLTLWKTEPWTNESKKKALVKITIQHKQQQQHSSKGKSNAKFQTLQSKRQDWLMTLRKSKRW